MTIGKFDSWLLDSVAVEYDHESITVLEHLARIIPKVNEVITEINNYVDKYNIDMNYLKTGGLQKSLEDIINKMYDDGRFPQAIDDIIVESTKKEGKLITGTSVDSINAQIQEYTTQGFKCVFPYGKSYVIDNTILIPSNSYVDFNKCKFIRDSMGIGDTVPNIFTMFENKNKNQGDTNIHLSNLIVDGNRQTDNLDNLYDPHRFSGVKITGVTNSTFTNIDIQNTVNGEDLQDTPAGGFYIDQCDNCIFDNVGGSYNLGTCVIFRYATNCFIKNSITHHNTQGSGISGRGGSNIRYYNITTYNNDYSALSVNSLNCMIDTVIAHDNGYSGVNIGHDAVDCYAHNCICNNVISYNNQYEGISVGGSNYVNISNASLYNNALLSNLSRANLMIFGNSSTSKLTNINSYNCQTIGIRIKSGLNHIIQNCEVFSNNGGLYCDPGVNVKVSNSHFHDNVTDGITFVTCTLCEVNSCELNNNARYGLFISGGGSHTIRDIFSHNNTTKDIYETASTLNEYNTKITSGVYYKNDEVELNNVVSFTDEVAKPFLRINLEANQRTTVELAIQSSFPGSSSSITALTKVLVAISSNSTNTVISDKLVLGTCKSLASYTMNLDVTVVVAPDNTYCDLYLNQNNEPLDAVLSCYIKSIVRSFVGTTIKRATCTNLT